MQQEETIQALIQSQTFQYCDIEFDGKVPYWTERRPLEKGRVVIVNTSGALTPPGFNVRTRIYDYGGKAFTVHKGILYFINYADQRIYLQKGQTVEPYTEKGPLYGDLSMTPYGLIAVGFLKRPFLALVTPSSYQILTEGHDFYASPTLSPDGTKLAWLSWDYPSMPWDETSLYQADFTAEGLQNSELVASGASHFQPSWSPDGKLHYISDKSGFGNIYCENRALYPLDAEFGLPQWALGLSTYAFLEDKILCSYFDKKQHILALLDQEHNSLTPLKTNGTYFTQIRASHGVAAYIKGSEARSPQIHIMTSLPNEELSPLSQGPEFLSFPSQEGRTVYGFYYAPKTTSDELPPLIVKIHGGPTGQTTSTFNPLFQFWTDAGFAVLDINYGGSTGYGTAYRKSLYGKWGIVDVQDAEAGALYLIEKGLVDPSKIVISGSSAGGYTALAAAATSTVFAAAASYYGISDLISLTLESGYFEAHYQDHLLGPYPEKEALYKERSPLFNADKITIPVIFFHGKEDPLVRVDQAERLYNSLQKRAIPSQLHIYEGEQHGFRKKETLIDTLQQELNFYSKLFFAIVK